MLKNHFTIPVFIPEEACPHQCVFCNQRKISGKLHLPEKEEVISIIEAHLKTIPFENSTVEIGFFGGNFTGIAIEKQIDYLKIAKPYIDAGFIKGIRLSTRPDYITPEILKMLGDHGVKTIELGAQSFDNHVLNKSGRGHNELQIIEASGLIKQFGFRLGLQIMVGLPDDTPEKLIYSAQKIVELKADDARIYPTLVIRGTALEVLFLNGQYVPLSLEDAVNQSKIIYLLFEKAGIHIIRVGLHPSEGLNSGQDLIAGPYHPSFRELVLTSIWKDILIENVTVTGNSIEIFVPETEINYAIGYQSSNRNLLLKKFENVRFKVDKTLKNRSINVVYH